MFYGVGAVSCQGDPSSIRLSMLVGIEAEGDDARCAGGNKGGDDEDLDEILDTDDDFDDEDDDLDVSVEDDDLEHDVEVEDEQEA